MKNKAQSKIKKVMKEYKAGKLSIGKSSKKVKKQKASNCYCFIRSRKE
jgi:hypothetical protein